MEDKKKKEVHIEIKLDEETAQGVYSNFAAVNHTDAEFTLDFIYVQPQGPQGKVRARVITSPRHAKRILAVLQDNVARYEARFGPIDPGAGSPSSPGDEPLVGKYH